MRLYFLAIIVSTWLASEIPIGHCSVSVPKLSQQERSQLRFHLENLWNEIHLLVLNQTSEERDIRRQEREFQFFQIFDRIPFTQRIQELRKELTSSAKENGIILSKIEVTSPSTEPPPIPQVVYTDTQRFRFSQEQLAETLNVRVIGQGPIDPARRWVESWSKQVIRLVIADAPDSKVRRINPSSWEIRAHAFRFRSIKYPQLLPREPLDLLPNWARKNPKSFAQEEPFLWSFVTRIQEWKPKASKAYENRRQFFLNDERMSFYLLQAKEVPIH